MFLYNFPLDIVQMILLFRVLKRCHRMVKTMQAFSLRQIRLIVPVVKEIIMEQRAPDQVMLIAANPESAVYQKTVTGHIHAVIVHRHGAVLYVLSGSNKVFRSQNIFSVLPKQLMDSLVAFVKSLQTLSAFLLMVPKQFHSSFSSISCW